MQPKTKTILFVLLSFLLGGISGYFFAMRNNGRPTADAPGRGDWKAAFAQRLQLDSVQRARVDSVVDSYRVHMGWHRQNLLLVRDTTRMEIRKLLTAEQNKRFDEYIKEMNEHEAKRRERERKR